MAYMIDLTGKTYANILAGMLARISDEYDKRDTSPIPTALSPAAYELEGFYLLLNQIQRGAFVTTASGEDLDNLAVIGGLTRQASSPAVRLGVFNVAVPIGARFSVSGGETALNFVVSKATGTDYEYEMTAETPGNIGNTYFGPLLPITTIPGLTSAVLSDIIVPGEDEEADESLRERLIARLNEKPFAGNIEAYRENILAIEGIGAVQVYPTWAGGGTVKCAILDATYAPASSTLVNTVQDAIDPTVSGGEGLGLAPIGATVTIVSAQGVTIDIEADVEPMTGYTLAQLQTPIEDAVESYLLALRKTWATPYGMGTSYALSVYISRVSATIVGVEGVANATNITINGDTDDLALTEDGTAQEVPILGTVTLHAV